VYGPTVLGAVRSLPASPVPPDLLDDAQTLGGALLTLAERFPQFECLTILNRDLREERRTFGELWTRARQIQGLLASAGFTPGSIVIIVMPTGAELLAAYFGVLLAGGVPGLVATPSNRYADETAYSARVGAILENAQAFAVYADDQIATLLRAQAAVLPPHTRILTPAQATTAADAVRVAVDPDLIATVQYSSGSTGTPKGVLLSHRAMLNNVRAVRDGLGLTPRDVSVNWIPLYHDMGLIDAFLLPMLSGCPTVLIPTMDFMREPSLWLRAVHRYSGTISWAPNFAYAICARRVPAAELEGLDLSSWRIAINAAEPVLMHTVEDFSTRFAAYGFRPEAMTPAWGLAENVTIATAHPVGAAPVAEHIDRQALATEHVARAVPPAAGTLSSVAIGRCLPRCALDIRGPRNESLPDRAVGTVWLHSDSLFAAYLRDPALTSTVLIDGWLNTGDRGYRVGEDLYFVSREKDLIVIGGEKYAPHDIEVVINRVAGVREGCVVAFGILDDQRGTETVAAVVETKETDAAALEALRDDIRRQVNQTTGLGLRHVLLVAPGGVEKTTSGKLARRATQRRYAEQLAL